MVLFQLLLAEEHLLRKLEDSRAPRKEKPNSLEIRNRRCQLVSAVLDLDPKN